MWIECTTKEESETYTEVYQRCPVATRAHDGLYTQKMKHCPKRIFTFEFTVHETLADIRRFLLLDWLAVVAAHKRIPHGKIQ